jgi:uncharacterized protein YdhG (YjbR/CyaY superfamily)
LKDRIVSKEKKLASFDEYLASTSPEVRPMLEEIREIVKRTVPEAEEIISYQMPAFRYGRIFIYFAAFKNHVGIYPPVKGDADLEIALLPYRGPKGNLRFPLDQPMPFDLIQRVVASLAKQYGGYWTSRTAT